MTLVRSVVLDPLARAIAVDLARKAGIDVGEQPDDLPPVPSREIYNVARVIDTVVKAPHAEIPIRIYRPSHESDLPVLVYIHGGGWFSGDLGSVDANCRELSARVGCIVISVDYRLAPAHKFPAALEDVDAVCKWTSQHVEEWGGSPHRVAIGGESAGGNLAAAECVLRRERDDPPFALQLLIYPVLDPDMDRAEIANSDDPIMPSGLQKLMWRRYANDEADKLNPLMAPIRATALAGMSPAEVFTAGTDPLRFEGAAYATAMSKDGVAVVHHHYEGMFHGFFGTPHPEAQRSMTDAVTALRYAVDRTRA